MSGDIQIKNCQISEEKKELLLEVQGKLSGQNMGDKLRLSAFFEGRNCDRRYPVIAQCMKTPEGTTSFTASARIELENIFFEYQSGQEENISLQFSYCDLKDQWIIFDKKILLPAKLFEKEKREKSIRKRLSCKIAYIFYTFFLPVWLLDGYLACKGFRKLHPAASGMHGKKAVLYHAHGIVYGRTGYGYSLREMKTNYFKKQYEKACKKSSQTEGVLFLSERRVEKGGNLDLLRNRMKQGKLCTVMEFLTTRPVHKLKWKELRRSARMAAKARVIVLEDFYPQLHALSIRPETKVVQMWHACGAFKLFGLSEIGLVEHLKQSTRNHRNYTAALASSPGVAPFYSEAFGVPESHIKPIGVPRTDIFFNAEYKTKTANELYEKYPVCKGKRIVLFAPTFRGSGNKTAYFPQEKFPVNEVMKALPEDIVLIIKNHPFVNQTCFVEEAYRNRVLDLSVQENINDLLFITSLLVTDYSSVIFEASLLNIPMLFYAFDLQEYLEQRNLYFDFPSFVPGRIVETVEELILTIIKELDNTRTVEEQEKYKEFRQFFLESLDGNSTERAVELIWQLYQQ